MTSPLRLLEQGRADIIEIAREHARRIAREKGYVTIDDVRAALGTLPRWVDRRFLGGVFASREFQRVGYVRSRRRECHARFIGVFRLKEGGR